MTVFRGSVLIFVAGVTVSSVLRAPTALTDTPCPATQSSCREHGPARFDASREFSSFRFLLSALALLFASNRRARVGSLEMLRIRDGIWRAIRINAAEPMALQAPPTRPRFQAALKGI